MARPEHSEGLSSRFDRRERGSVRPRTIVALGMIASAAFMWGFGARIANDIRNSVEVGVNNAITDVGDGTVTDVVQLPPAMRFARSTVMVEGVGVELRGYAEVMGRHIEAPGDLAIIYRNNYGAEQWVDLLIGQDAASMTRVLDLVAGEGRVEIEEGAFSSITSEVSPGSGHNVRPGPLAGGYAAIAQQLEAINEDWDLGTNSLEGRASGLAVMQAQRLASQSCTQAAAPIIENVLTDSIADYTAELINELNPALTDRPEGPATAEDITVVLPDLNTVTVENQYEQYFDAANRQMEESNNNNPALSYRFEFPQLPTGDDLRCEVPASVNVELFEEVSPALEDRLRGTP